MTHRLIAAFLAAPLLIATPLATAAAQDAGQGERMFRTRCASCHAVAAGQNRIGPHLAGIIGRQAGSVEGVRYSQALRDSGITWDEQKLNDFLANPRGVVAGTSMTIAVPDAAQRGSIIAYLQAQP